MKFIARLFLLLIFFSACGKDNDPPPVDPPPVDPPVVIPPKPKDTLAAGWTLDSSFLGINSDIYFVNNKGYMSAEQIYTSGDGGLTWRQMYNAGSIVENIAMWGESDAIFSSLQTSKIFITHNGGNTLDSVNLADQKLTDVFFAGPKVAYAIGVNFWRSDDAGDHWTKVVDPGKPSFQLTYKSLFFLNEQMGWIAGGDAVYKTTDGGNHWIAQQTPGFAFGTQLTNSGSVYFSDSLHGAIADFYSFGVTTNSGQTWSKKFALQEYYHDIHFINAEIGYLTDKQYIWKTTDGGATWKKEVVLLNRKVTELHFTDANHGWACGPGFVLRYAK